MVPAKPPAQIAVHTSVQLMSSVCTPSKALKSSWVSTDDSRTVPCSSTTVWATSPDESEIRAATVARHDSVDEVSGWAEQMMDFADLATVALERSANPFDQGLAQSTVSAHLACPRDCGLVTSRPQRRASMFSLARPELFDLLAAAEGVLAATGDAVTLCWRDRSGVGEFVLGFADPDGVERASRWRTARRWRSSRDAGAVVSVLPGPTELARLWWSARLGRHVGSRGGLG